MPADMGGGNLSDIHRVTLLLSSTFYHFTPPKVQQYFETSKKIGRKVLKKNIVGASRHQKFYQGNEQNKVLYKAFALSGRRAKCDDTQGAALGYELLPLRGVWGNRIYINCCI